MTTRRRSITYAVAALLGGIAALSLAGPAAAHTGITINPARAGARNAVATVNAEAESDSAGVAKVQIFLPVGITPDDITTVSLPKQWKLTKQTDSYTVQGPALAIGTGAKHKVKIRQLPTYASISFKVLQTYSDGRTDRWIALPSKGDPEPANPAPTVKLAGGKGAAPSTTPTTAAPTTAPPSSSPASASPGDAAPSSAVAAPEVTPAGNESSSSRTWWWVGGIALVAIMAGAVVTVVRRKPAS